MKYILTAAHSAEAHMLSHVLQNEGIDAQVHGDYLQGAVGGLPVEGHIKIAVPDKDVDKARLIIQNLQNQNKETNS